MSYKDMCLKGINCGKKPAHIWGGYHAKDYLFVNLIFNFHFTFNSIFR